MMHDGFPDRGPMLGGPMMTPGGGSMTMPGVGKPNPGPLYFTPHPPAPGHVLADPLRTPPGPLRQDVYAASTVKTTTSTL